MTHPVNNETLDLYSKGVTLYKFIHEGRPTTTKRHSLLFHLSPANNTVPIRHPQQRNLHQQSLKSRATIQFQVNRLNIA